MNTFDYSNSQVSQDLFVINVLKGKREGYFIEIGSHDAIYINNTFVLENKYDWKGLMIDYDNTYEESYIKDRPKSWYIINDARNINYKLFLEDHNFPKNIDYLQIDLNVINRSTIDTLILLNKTIFDDYKFAIITFEHDFYRGNYFDTREISRQIFKDRGYILVFPDVKNKSDYDETYLEFEDWYVHPDLVDMDYISKIKSEVSMKYSEIIQRMKNM